MSVLRLQIASLILNNIKQHRQSSSARTQILIVTELNAITLLRLDLLQTYLRSQQLIISYHRTQYLLMSNNKQQFDFTALFGFCGGILTSIIFQPFDVVKMSLMLTTDKNTSHRVFHTIKNVVQENGIFGLWKGLGISTIRNATGAGIYFYLLRYFEKANEGMSFFNSASARISSILLNPMTIVETKILMPGPKALKQTSAGFQQLVHHKQKLHAMSKGIVSSCLKQGLFAGVYYQIFLALKTMEDSYHIGINFINGVLAGFVATAFSHPFQLARAQIQADMGGSIRGIFGQIYKNQGWKGFFKGLSPRLLRKPVINTTTFVFVQKMQQLRGKLQRQ